MCNRKTACVGLVPKGHRCAERRFDPPCMNTASHCASVHVTRSKLSTADPSWTTLSYSHTKGNIPLDARGPHDVGPWHIPASCHDASTLTRLGCLFPRDMTEAGKAWPRLPTVALWAGAEPRSPCMSPWLLGMAAVWPTA